MRTLERIAAVIATDRDGISQAQTTAGAVDALLNGAGVASAVATLNPPRRIRVFSGSNIAASVFTIDGTDRAGTAISDTVTGINNSTVATNKLFATVTRVATGAAVASNFEVGWNVESITSWIFLGNRVRDPQWKLRAFFAAAGTCNYDIEGTSQNMLRDRVSGEHPDDLITLASAQTGNYTSDNDTPLTAVRLKANSQDVAITLRVLPASIA